MPGSSTFSAPGLDFELPHLKTLIVQTDLTAFDVSPDADFVVNIKSETRTHRSAAIRRTDFDGNGSVDGQDFIIWSNNLGLGPGATRGDGDADDDGDVDGNDFLLWQQDVLTPANFTSQGASVPEPSSWLLLLLAAIPVVPRRAIRK